MVRAQPSFKYTIDDLGLDWVKARDRAPLSVLPSSPPRPFKFTSQLAMPYGWATGEDGAIISRCSSRMAASSTASGCAAARTACALSPKSTRGDVPPERRTRMSSSPTFRRAARREIAALLKRIWPRSSQRPGALLRLNSMACVALPTCGLAMAESERYLPFAGDEKIETYPH